MATSVIMPALELAQETGKVIRWLKAPGDAVVKGEPLLEIETDKVTTEIEAPASGILMHVSAREGDVVPVGQAIAQIGAPDQMCVIPPRPAGGYQAAAEELWLRNGAVISAIFRDTTLEAFEGCLFGPATGTCGLTGQLLVRIGPPGGDGDPCALQ